jgi:putative tricarboxylic transport membrane protein
MSKLWAERLTALGMIVVAAFFLVQSTDMPGTSGTFPQFTTTIIILLAVVMIVRSFLTHDRKLQGEVSFDFSYFGMKPVYIMVVGVVYTILIFQIGFYVTSVLFFFLVTWMTGYKNLKGTAIVAVVLFPLMYLFFTIGLGADLPRGVLM